jgi:hypothetical protein
LSPAPKNMSVLVACSLVRYARQTQTVNLYAPLTLRFGLTHAGVVRWAARRSEMQVMFAVRVRLVRSSLGPASTCIEDLRERTSSVAARSARPQKSSYRVRHRRLESWTSSQERRGLCQAPDTTSASRAQKVEDGTSSLFARKHTDRKLEPRGSTFQGCYWGPSGGVLVAFGTRVVLSGQKPWSDLGEGIA